MAQTPASSPVAYITVDQFLTLKDNNAIGQLAVDNGQQLTPEEIETNARVLFVLSLASGDIESALLQSERYSTVDLAAFNGVSQNFLISIAADIAMFKLYGCRDGNIPPETTVDQYNKAQDKLQMLQNGQRVLSFVETIEAGVADNQFMSVPEIINDNLISTAPNYQRVMGVRQALRRWQG
jgi:hypothetical protein